MDTKHNGSVNLDEFVTGLFRYCTIFSRNGDLNAVRDNFIKSQDPDDTRMMHDNDSVGSDSDSDEEIPEEFAAIPDVDAQRAAILKKSCIMMLTGLHSS